MSARLDAARLRAADTRRRFMTTLDVAKRRLAPRALAAEGIETLASRAARIGLRARAGATVARGFATAAALAGIGAAVLLRLGHARASMKHADASSVDRDTDAA